MAIKYPTSVKTEDEKLEYLCRCREKLRLEHNEKGADFRNGDISEAQWLDYKNNSYRPRSFELEQSYAPIKDSRIQSEAIKQGVAARDVDIASIKEPLKISTKHDANINLSELVK